MQSENVVINLDSDEALVLFEMLSRWSNDGPPLQVCDSGEEVALNGLLALLEKQLVNPFGSDYRERVAQALAILRQRGGVV